MSAPAMGPNPVPKRLITDPGAAGFVKEFRRTSVDDSVTNAATSLQRRKLMLGDLLQSIEQVPQEQVAAQILALQTRLEASLQTTSILYRLSIVNYL